MMSDLPTQHAQYGGGTSPVKKRSAFSSAAGIIGEIFLTLAVVCALYILWQLWWTGVESEHTQNQQMEQTSWSKPGSDGGSYKIAAKQTDEPPIEEGTLGEGDVVGEIYIPRFGQQWKRLIVEGTSEEQLARHGMGHYPMTQLPGQLGNFAVAGHRSGYGEPLGNVPELKEGDPIIVRTENYWYVYHYTNHEIVLPNQVEVIAPVPNKPGQAPDNRYITLTTCEPRYTSATHRWISYGTYDYWAKVSDGIPAELATQGDDGSVTFVQNDTQTWTSRIPPLTTILLWLIIAYVVLYVASAIVWRYPGLRRTTGSATTAEEPTGAGRARASQKVSANRYMVRGASIYGWIYRHHPGIGLLRWILMIILGLIATVLLFQWGFPWLASNVPFLQLTSNFVSAG